MAYLKINDTHVVWYSEEDAELVNKYSWIVDDRGRCAYAYTITYVGGKKSVLYMHRLILQDSLTEERNEVDHINHNGLDNRRENLRACSRRENTLNRRGRSKASSRYKGVERRDLQSGTRWVVEFKDENGKRLGNRRVFTCEHEAACWYNVCAFSLYGEFAYQNEVPERVWSRFCSSPAPKTYKDTTSSRYHGVSVEIRNGKKLYRASLSINGKQRRLGSSRDEKKAAKLVNDAVFKYGLDTSKLNNIP
jgi:hypothetical protein